jgi:hypothetical protein
MSDHKRHSDENSEHKNRRPAQSRTSSTVSKIGIVGGIGVLALLLGQIVNIKENVQKLFPWFAPFDASISIRDVRVTKASPTQKVFDGPSPEPAMEVQIEWVQDKTGPSKLTECRPELTLHDEYSGNKWPRQPETISDPTQEKVFETFVVRKEHYTTEGAFRVICDKRVTPLQVVKLPEALVPPKPQTASYFVCTGEYREACGGAQTWLPCYTNVEAWAKSQHPVECVNVKLKTLSDVGGNRCGYATIQVSCTSSN